MNPLSRRRIGNSQLAITALGLGGAALGGLFKDSSEEVASQTVHHALKLGINFFDTAPLYGAGKSESRFGRALAGVDRESYVLATKIGYALVPESEGSKDIYFPFENPPSLRPIVDLSYDAAMRSFEESLQRLRIGRIDILHIHDPEDRFDVVMKGAYRAADKLRREGVIRAVSIGTNHAETVVRFVESGQFDCCLLAGRYTLLDHAALRDALPLCQKRNVSIILGGPYNSGILATGAVPGALFNYVPADGKVLETVQRIQKVCSTYLVPLKAAALQFPLAHPAVACVIPGGRSEAEVDENFRMMSYVIPSEFWTDLRRGKLLPDDAPLPIQPSNHETQAPSETVKER